MQFHTSLQYSASVLPDYRLYWLREFECICKPWIWGRQGAILFIEVSVHQLIGFTVQWNHLTRTSDKQDSIFFVCFNPRNQELSLIMTLRIHCITSRESTCLVTYIYNSTIGPIDLPVYYTLLYPELTVVVFYCHRSSQSMAIETVGSCAALEDCPLCVSQMSALQM